MNVHDLTLPTEASAITASDLFGASSLVFVTGRSPEPVLTITPAGDLVFRDATEAAQALKREWDRMRGADVPAMLTIDPRTGRAVGDHGTADQAIEFALDQGLEADTFLRAWREGSLEEWPEFYDFLRREESAK